MDAHAHAASLRFGYCTMCGIFAYLNYGVPRERKYILDALYRGLRRLEYRGYDSAGLSMDVSSVEKRPIVYRAQGKIDALVEEVCA